MLRILGPQIKSIQAKEKSTEKSTGPVKNDTRKIHSHRERKTTENPQRNPQPKNPQKNPLRNPRQIFDTRMGAILVPGRPERLQNEPSPVQDSPT
jgi:hypothetical protein